jgi:hypothetical protein
MEEGRHVSLVAGCFVSERAAKQRNAAAGQDARREPEHLSLYDYDSAHAIGRRYDAFWKTPRYDLAAPSIAPLQVLRFTTTYFQSVLADNWAASPPRFRSRTFQTCFPK